MHCQFCENPAIQERIVTSNELVMVFPTNTPIVPGHMLICPVRCVSASKDLTIDEMAALQKMIAYLQEVLKKEFDAEGFNCAWNEGEVAGQTVPHLHIHVLPRRSGDTGVVSYEPRSFLYRPGSRETTPEDELKSVSNILRPYFL